MLGAIKHGLAGLFTFSGRDARQTFWYYVLFVAILRFVASFAISIPLMISSMTGAFEAARVGASEREVQAQMMTRMTEALGSTMWLTIAIGLISCVLLCASVVRRLQDSDLSGLWVLVPGALYLGAISQIPHQIELAKEMMTKFATNPPKNPYAMMAGQGWMALLGWLPILIVIIIGVRQSTPGPNRYGEEPVSY